MNSGHENSKEEVFCLRNFITSSVVNNHIQMNQQPPNQPQQSNTIIIDEAKLAAIFEKFQKYKKHDEDRLRQQQQQKQLQAGSELNENQMNDDNAMESINIKRYHFRSRALSLQQSANEYENYKERSKFNFMKRCRSSVT